MAIEYGVKLGTAPLSALERSGELRGLLDRFSWFYTGAEFCENLLDDQAAEDAVLLQRSGKSVCLLTPPLSEKGVARLRALFRALRARCRAGKLDPARLEVTVNDFGAIALAAAEELPFRLNLGRQLQFNAFLLTRSSLKALNRRALEFFRARGITRYEVSTTGRLPRTNFRDAAFGLDPRKFSFTLYYPYLNLTTGRTCITGMPDIPPEASVRGVACGFECRACAFQVVHPWVKEKLYIKGNSVFMKFPDKFYSSPQQLERRRIDRLVYCPLP